MTTMIGFVTGRCPRWSPEPWAGGPLVGGVVPGAATRVVVVTFGVRSWKLCVFVNAILVNRFAGLQLTPLPLNTCGEAQRDTDDEALERARRDRAADEQLSSARRLRVEREERGRVLAVRPIELRCAAHREVRSTSRPTSGAWR